MSIITLPCGRQFQIDESDIHLLGGLNWHADKRKHTTYVRGRTKGQSKGGIYLHNLIIGGRADHRDGNGLDNRRANLRPCTQAQNCMNSAAKSAKAYKGVYGRGQKFYAQVYAGGVSHSSHGHLTAEDAARSYDRMAKEVHGEFARLNFGDAA